MNMRGGDPMGTARPMTGLKASAIGASVELLAGDSRKCIVDLKSKNDLAEMMTVCVGRYVQGQIISGIIPAGGGGVNLPAIFGTVIWGMGGVSFEADFDIINGVSFSIPANNIKISATYPNISALNPPAIQVTAGIAYGTTAKSVLRRTIVTGDVEFGSVDPGASVYMVIPPFASDFTVQSQQAPNVKIIVFDGAYNTLSQLNYISDTNLAENQANEFSIPGNGAVLGLTNNGAIRETYQVIFDLAI